MAQQKRIENINSNRFRLGTGNMAPQSPVGKHGLTIAKFQPSPNHNQLIWYNWKI